MKRVAVLGAIGAVAVIPLFSVKTKHPLVVPGISLPLNNYSEINTQIFLIATEQINQVGQEMSELIHLIENTQKLIDVKCFAYFHLSALQDARAVRPSPEYKSVKQSSSNTTTAMQKRIEEIKKAKKSPATSSAASPTTDATVPSWLLKAADDVAQ